MLSCRLCGVHFFSRFSFTSLYRCLIARHHVKFLHAHTNIQFELCVFSILVRWKLQSHTWALVYCVQLFNFHGAPRAVVLSSYKPAWICWFDIFLNGNFSIIYFFYFIHFLTCCLFTRMLLIFAREAPCLCCFNEEEKNHTRMCSKFKSWTLSPHPKFQERSSGMEECEISRHCLYRIIYSFSAMLIVWSVTQVMTILEW